MDKCPRCGCEATGENRLVTESCGHLKCRLCLVADVADCLECKVSKQKKDPAAEEKDATHRTSLDQKIIVTDNGYHCTVCKKDFRSRTHQYYHLSCGDDLLKKFSCKECGRRFATRSHLKYHMNNHEKSSKHNCHICGKTFQQLVVLQRHLRTHNQERHECQHCPKAFRSESSLKSHLVVHSDLGLPFKCDVCLKSFQNKANLKQHSRKHDQKSTRHKCKDCQKSFLRQTTLRLHMKRHLARERQSCPLCDKSYNDADALARHLKQHKTGERYRCNLCDITVSRKDNMLRHLRSMHPGSTFESSVEITSSTAAVEESEQPAPNLRYNSVIKSVGNVEPVAVHLPQPMPLEQNIPAQVPLPLPDTMPKENVQLYRKIILDLDNEEYSNELSLDESDAAQNVQDSPLHHRQPRDANFSEMHWRKNFKCFYENEHTN
ncbi:uncharacterized protein Dana_GF22998 [Drosophila ananassae]|uniref:C2H2-type domain-containing protein n=1 Tax=Drosophila ananassae TaxID=7217 RepID=B3MSU4_DROAN|nr:zinc finger protein 782 [Drosophila ananassae]EDV30334.2 uncharacterized protein Dana_GF22998 [Drosophila ananassae]